MTILDFILNIKQQLFLRSKKKKWSVNLLHETVMRLGYLLFRAFVFFEGEQNGSHIRRSEVFEVSYYQPDDEFIIEH